VMIECDNVETKANMLQHTGVKSWFHVHQNVVHDFVSDERIVWVDIEGIPLNVWSRETFTRIRKKWGEALDIEDNVDSSFGRKRLCIKTKLPLSILESFKVIFKGKVYMVRAKELFTWNPIFLGQKEMEYTSDEDSDEVSETNFGDNSSILINHIDESEKQQSGDPFNIYRLLRKQLGYDSHEVSSSISHPSGFTPDVSVIQNENGQSTKEIPVVEGSVLGVMEDMIRVGKAMGYSMDGCMKDLEQIIGTQGVGNSGGILCVWEATVFKKDYATISDNFVAIYGTWLPSNSKVLFVAIYAPQQVSQKRILWDYVSTLINRQNGEDLKVRIRAWIKDKRSSVSGEKDSIKKELSDIDRHLDGGDVSDSNLLRRSELHHNLYNINQMESKEKRLSDVQASDLERRVSRDEIRLAVWNCGENKSSGPDGYSFEFFRKYWNLVGSDLCDAITDAKFVNDFQPVSLIRSVYKVVTKADFSFAKASVLVNGSPTIEVPFHCGLKQGDPSSPYLFILIMESLNMSFTRAIDECVFKGVHLHGSTSISHLFYADDVMFIGEWYYQHSLLVFLASGLKINIQKSQVLGVGIPSSIVMQAASSIGCGVLHMQFRYLGVMVGECMSRHNAWASTVDKLRPHLSKWKVKTLSIGGRLTLLKAVLGTLPLYNMSIFKVLRFISQDGSLWFRVIKALYGTSIDSHPVNLSSNWCSIIHELHLLVGKGFHFLDHCKKRIGNGRDTCF
nr:RNA-directed DNA polymerase, eukaryota [Tanacetum cinerariifolium]